MELFELIRRDFQLGGHSIRSIASKYGVHRRMVRQALENAVPPFRKEVRRSASKLSVVSGFIDSVLIADQKVHRKQRHTAHRVWTRIKSEFPGFSISESSVRKYVSRKKEELGLSRRETFVPQSYKPGHEAQVDWYEAYADIGSETLKLQVFCMRSMDSAASFHRAYLHATQQAFLEAHEHAFRYFGGVFQVLRYDNLKVAVKKILRGYRREETSRFIAFRSHWGFSSEFCNAASGNEKGGVEGEVGYFRRNHWVPVPKASDLEALNKLLLDSCRAAEKRIIGGRKQSVGELMISEQAFLQPLPIEGFDLSEDTFCRVNQQGCAVVRTNWYSVPLRPGLEVHAKIFADRVELHHSGRCVASHPRSYARGQRILNLEHYLEILERKPGALAGSTPLQQWKEQGRWPQEFDILWREMNKRNGKSDGTRQMIDLLKLGKKHGYDKLTMAVNKALNHGCWDSAAIKHILLCENKVVAQALPLKELGALTCFERPQPSLNEYDDLLTGVN